MASLTELADALYREEVQRARAMRADEKLLEGPRLFDRACRLMADGVRHELDSAYLDRWSAEHGTSALLTEIRASVPCG